MSPTQTSTRLQGQPVIELSLPDGARATVALQGAQALTWCTADGRERLFLSPAALFDGTSPIRGGVPVCFPQFNQRVIDGRALPKHGLARGLPWRVGGRLSSITEDALTLELAPSDLPDSLRTSWPHAFVARVEVRLTSDSLRVQFSVRNMASTAWPFALALHTYLQVSDIAEVRLDGLQNVRYWDAVRHPGDPTSVQAQSEASLRFGTETDRVYQGAPARLQLVDDGPAAALGLSPDHQTPSRQVLHIEQSEQFTETVVWNPGPELCATLKDMPADGYRRMLCVEAARIDEPVMLEPDASWQGWQRLSLT